MPQHNTEKRTIPAIKKMKKRGEKISALTAYDFPTAQLLSNAGIDIILVGDSLGMVVQGRKNTLAVTIDHLVYHTSLVTRAEPISLVVSDMPYGSYHVSIEQTVENALRCVKEGGAEAVKVEGGNKRFPMIEALLDAEIPVMGHLGLTPQSVNSLGGFKVQGKLKQDALQLIDDALELERLGAFSIILESIPMELAKEVTERVSIPTIGIGAGIHCDGQILVFHDLMGYSRGYLPKFVRQYADINRIAGEAITHYIDDIQSQEFPGAEESYQLKKEISELLK